MALYDKNVTPTKKYCNNLVIVDNDWLVNADGSLKLAHDKSAKVALVKLEAPVGSRLIKVTSHLGIKAHDASNKTGVTLSIRKVIHKADNVTDAEVKGVSAVEYEEATKSDIAADIANETVREGYSYYARVTVSTADNANCTAALVGATLEYQ